MQRGGGNPTEEKLVLSSEELSYGGSSIDNVVARNKLSLALREQTTTGASARLDVVARSKPDWTDEGWVRQLGYFFSKGLAELTRDCMQ